MLDQTQGVRHLIDRLEMGPRLKKLVTEMEKELGPLDQVPEKGGAEVRKLLQLVDGQGLCAAIVAKLIDQLEVEEEAPPERTLTLEQRWSRAADRTEQIPLLLIDDAYYAFHSAAERIADTLKTHLVEIHRTKAIALPIDKQAEWLPLLVEANLDVVLMEEDDDGFISHNILDAEPDPLDHDGDGRKGGSLPGDESTARKGLLRRAAEAITGGGAGDETPAQ